MNEKPPCKRGRSVVSVLERFRDPTLITGRGAGFHARYSLSGIGEPSGKVGDVFWFLSSRPDE